MPENENSRIDFEMNYCLTTFTGLLREIKLS